MHHFQLLCVHFSRWPAFGTIIAAVTELTTRRISSSYSLYWSATPGFFKSAKHTVHLPNSMEMSFSYLQSLTLLLPSKVFTHLTLFDHVVVTQPVSCQHLSLAFLLYFLSYVVHWTMILVSVKFTSVSLYFWPGLIPGLIIIIIIIIIDCTGWLIISILYYL